LLFSLLSTGNYQREMPFSAESLGIGGVPDKKNGGKAAK
jgi:hypothetical protein